MKKMRGGSGSPRPARDVEECVGGSGSPHGTPLLGATPGGVWYEDVWGTAGMNPAFTHGGVSK